MDIHLTRQRCKNALMKAVTRHRRQTPLSDIPVRQVPGEHKIPPALRPYSLIEHWEMISDDSNQGYLPFRLVKPNDWSTGKQLPLLIFLHPTGSDKNYHAVWEARCVERGYMTISVDARYHGGRQDSDCVYQESLVNAWRQHDHPESEKPFLLDNVWDVQRILDYIERERRNEVDMNRIGVTGMSLGGMHSWFASVVDERIHCSAPICGVQFFRYALENGCYHDRVMSIPNVFRAAVEDVQGDDQLVNFPACVEKNTVEQVWNVLLPGMLEEYDADKSLGSIAPRPLLIVTGGRDGRNPVEGIRLAYEKAKDMYIAFDAEDAIELYVEEDAGHECTKSMMNKIDTWMDLHLL